MKEVKTEEEIINKKDIDNRFYSTSLNIEDCYDNSDNREVIEGIPVIDEPYSIPPDQPNRRAFARRFQGN